MRWRSRRLGLAAFWLLGLPALGWGAGESSEQNAVLSGVAPMAYASAGVIDLEALAPELIAEGTLRVRHVSGPMFQFRVSGKMLEILAPAEQSEDTSSVVQIAGATRKWSLSIPWRTTVRKSTASPQRDSVRVSQNGRDYEAELEVVGLAGDGVVGPGTTAIEFRVTTTPAMTRPLRDVEVTLSGIGYERDVAAWFVYDVTKGAAVLRPEHVEDLVEVVRTGKNMTLAVVFGDRARRLRFRFERRLTWAGGRMAIRATGSAREALDRRVTVRGEHTGCTRVLALDGDGSVSTEGLPHDTYRVALVEGAREIWVFRPVVLSAGQESVSLEVREDQLLPKHPSVK